MKNALAASLITIAATILICPVAFPQDVSGELRRASDLYNAREFDKAAQLLEQVCSQHPDLGSAQGLLGNAYYQLGRMKEAREALARAVSHGCMTPEVLSRIAQIDQKEGRFPSLLASLRAMMLVDPGNLALQLLYADVLASISSNAEAEGAYKAIIEKDPASPDAYMHLANLCISEDRHEKAAEYLETGFILGGSSPRMIETMAELSFRNGDYQRSIIWYDLALKTRDGTDERMRLRKAEVLFLAGDFEQAESSAHPLADSRDEQIAGKALVLLGQIALKLDKPDDAVKYWERAVLAGADASQLFAFLGSHYFNSGQYDKAAHFLSKRVEGDRIDESTLYYLISSLIHDGQTEQARDRLQNYIENYGLNDRAKILVHSLRTPNS